MFTQTNIMVTKIFSYFNICSRMSTNNSQIGNTPSEILFKHNNNESNIDQLLSIQLVTTNQSLLQFSTTDMISTQMQLIHNAPEHDTVTTRQQGRRR
jgi:hypothetical protein